MPINYVSPQPAHRHCSRCHDRDQMQPALNVGVADLVAYADDLEARVDHLAGERDEARRERDELGALLDEVAEIAHDGVEGTTTHFGVVYRIDRLLRDQAPAAYRERLDHYRNGGELS